MCVDNDSVSFSSPSSRIPLVSALVVVVVVAMDLRQSSSPPTAVGVLTVKQKAHSWEVSTAGRVYVVLVLIETISLMVLCGLSIYSARVHADEETDAHSVEATSVVAMVASAALLFFASDSILLENVFQFYTSQVLHGLITAYTIYHYTENGDDLGHLYQRFSLWVMIAVCIFQGAYLALAWPVHTQFGWRLYKKIGGNIAIRPLYRTATIFFSLLKLDFALGVLLMLLALFYLLSGAVEIALDCIACVVTLGWLILGFAFVQRESTRLGWFFFIFSVLEPAFIIYKLISMHSGISDNEDDDYPVFSWREFLLTGCLALVVRLACLGFGVLCWRNFDLGLRDKMWPSDAQLAHARAEAARHSPQHAQIGQDDYLGRPVVIVRTEPEHTSALREYIQPLL